MTENRRDLKQIFSRLGILAPVSELETYGLPAPRWPEHVLRMLCLHGKELIPNPVVQGGASPEQSREGARMDERADQELEELLLGTDTTSATDLEEEANDRQSDKVGA
jgi:hypothetical protein